MPALLVGCNTYAPLPLATAPALAHNLGLLDHKGIDVGAPLNIEQVAALGHVFPLRSVADFRSLTGEAEISSENLQPMVAVTGRIENRGIGSVIADVKTILTRPGMVTPGLRYEIGGLYAQQQTAFKGLARVFAAALAADYAVTQSIAAPDVGWDYAGVGPHRTLCVARRTGVTAIDLVSHATRSFGAIVHGHAVVSLAGGATVLVTSGDDGSVRLFDLKTGKEQRELWWALIPLRQSRIRQRISPISPTAPTATSWCSIRNLAA